jgi:hypothetical protein
MLISSLKALIQRDPEQEISGVAISKVETAFATVSATRPDIAMPELFSADQIGSGDGIPAADVLVVAEQLDAALGPLPRLRRKAP